MRGCLRLNYTTFPLFQSRFLLFYHPILFILLPVKCTDCYFLADSWQKCIHSAARNSCNVKFSRSSRSASVRIYSIKVSLRRRTDGKSCCPFCLFRLFSGFALHPSEMAVIFRPEQYYYRQYLRTWDGRMDGVKLDGKKGKSRRLPRETSSHFHRQTDSLTQSVGLKLGQTMFFLLTSYPNDPFSRLAFPCEEIS